MRPDADFDDDCLIAGEDQPRPGDVLRLDQIDGPETSWLWPNRLPVGHVTVVAGASGSGKSLLAAELAARVSSGAAWPGAADERPVGTVLIAQCNGHENSILKRRLLVAGGDERRLAVVNRCPEAWENMTPAESLLFTLEGALVQARGVSLVVVDHLLGWLGQSPLGRLQSPPGELAALFEKLEDLAARLGIALVVLWRLEKGVRGGQARALDALQAAAPIVWLLARDAYGSEDRLATCARNQLGAQAGNLAFRIEDHRLTWQTEARQTTADDALVVGSVDRHERRQAGEWLLELLSQGPIEAKRLWEEARQCGLAERTVRRAAAELGLHPTKDGKSGAWFWGLGVRGDAPSHSAVETAPEGMAAPSVAALAPVGSLAAAAGLRVDLRRDAAPSVAAFEPVGSLAAAAGPPPDSASNRQHRLSRRERRALERTISICRDG